MTRSELIERILERAPHVPRREVEAIVHAVFACMAEDLVAGKRIELRGFGVFSVRTRRARTGRNPKTGQSVSIPERRTLSFAAGKELRERLNAPAPQQSPAPPAAAEPVARPASALPPLPPPVPPAFAPPAAG